MITKQTQPYEILVRYRDGTPFAAHFIEIETIAEGDTVLASTVGAAQPIPLDTGLFDQAGVAALNRVTELEAENIALKLAGAAVVDRLTELEAENAALRQQIEELRQA
jgi:hypothetical protein